MFDYLLQFSGQCFPDIQKFSKQNSSPLFYCNVNGVSNFFIMYVEIKGLEHSPFLRTLVTTNLVHDLSSLRCLRCLHETLLRSKSRRREEIGRYEKRKTQSEDLCKVLSLVRQRKEFFSTLFCYKIYVVIFFCTFPSPAFILTKLCHIFNIVFSKIQRSCGYIIFLKDTNCQ